MRLINDEDDGATEPLYAQSDDEHGALKAKAGRYSDRKRARFIWSFAVICYLILMAFRKDSRVFPLTVAGTPFAGDPSPELDQAWHDLLEVSKEDLDYYNVTSLPLADGTGFASELFVTHELHCLKKVRQYIYKEAYFEQVQGFARNELKRHIGSNDVTARSWGSHQCIDFDALITWTRERAVDIFRPGVIPKPEDLGAEHFTEKKAPQ
uniref:Uncharacterized protein n=1 Tax=Talaromyces marneffei PM1 TaxID=1077442 RepID=A0A093X8V6_TALMA